MAPVLDLANPPRDFTHNPYPLYRQILKESPLLEQPDSSYVVASHQLLNEIYRDTQRFSSDKQSVFGDKYGDSPLFEHHTTSLVFNDAPLHTRVRKIMAGAMTPSAIAHMELGLNELVDDLLDQMIDQTAFGEVDVIEQFAAQIPINIIGDLFNMPMEERGPLRAWSLSILGALEPKLTAKQERNGNKAVVEFSHYLEELSNHRRKYPGNPKTDVLTRLMFSDKGKLSTKELLHNCIFILNAGHETTTNLIGNAIGAIDQDPTCRKELLTQAEVSNTAVDEFLRYESPNQLGNRLTTTDTMLAGFSIPAQTNLHLMIGAANRDPTEFHEPHKLDIHRQPNRHLAFAGGPHACIGLNLARMEGRVALSKFLRRFPNYEVTHADRSNRLRFRGYDRLLVKL